MEGVQRVEGELVVKGRGSTEDVCVKQKTAYEMLRSLVGSEMCIRDSIWTDQRAERDDRPTDSTNAADTGCDGEGMATTPPVSYTHLTLPTIYPV